jgi:hypothetical protein
VGCMPDKTRGVNVLMSVDLLKMGNGLMPGNCGIGKTYLRSVPRNSEMRNAPVTCAITK